MQRSLFGTDGIRGRANTHPMTAASALKIGMAAGRCFRRDESNKHRVVIGKDTRRSGYMIENALTAGLTATGMNVLLLGPVPTPGVALLTRSMRADLGVMISASHNPHHDNGIKFFGPDGRKLKKDMENAIETNLSKECELPSPTEIGRARRIDDGLGRYIEFVKTTFPKRLRLNGLRIVIDCANGAAYRAAPDVLWELGAEVVPLGTAPNGFNINHECGSTDTRQAIRKIQEAEADVGVCLDGDADRVVVIDEKGSIIAGDQLLALFALEWAKSKRLAERTLVVTELSNIGLDRFLNSAEINVVRTQVGDRHVSEKMLKEGFNLGGEQSGHVVMSDYATTGDGLVAALQFLAMLKESRKKASELASVFDPVPQLQANVAVSSANSAILSDEQVKSAISEAQEMLDGIGRLVVRNSGTEPIVRIMAECEDLDLMKYSVDMVAEKIRLSA